MYVKSHRYMLCSMHAYKHISDSPNLVPNSLHLEIIVSI